MHVFAVTSEHAFAFPLRHEMQAALTWALFRRSNGGSDGFSFCGANSLVREEISRKSGVDSLGASSLGTVRMFAIVLRSDLGGKELLVQKSNAA